MNEKPQLIIRTSPEREVVYQCSVCGQMFPLPQNEPPKESVARLWAAFRDHTASHHNEAASKHPEGGLPT